MWKDSVWNKENVAVASAPRCSVSGYMCIRSNLAIVTINAARRESTEGWQPSFVDFKQDSTHHWLALPSWFQLFQRWKKNEKSEYKGGNMAAGWIWVPSHKPTMGQDLFKSTARSLVDSVTPCISAAASLSILTPNGLNSFCTCPIAFNWKRLQMKIVDLVWEVATTVSHEYTCTCERWAFFFEGKV